MDAALVQRLSSELAANDRPTLDRLLKTLIKVGTNVLNDPLDAKKRKLRTNNEKVAQSLLAPPGGRSVLMSFGFVDEGEFYVMPDDVPLEKVRLGVALLQKVADKLSQKTATQTTMSAPPPPAMGSSVASKITYNCTKHYSCAFKELYEGLAIATGYLRCFRCNVFVFGSTDGRFTDKEQMTAYCRAKGFRQPEQLAEACCSGERGIISRIMGMGMSDDYSNPANVMDRIKSGNLDIYATNTPGPPGTTGMIVCMNPHILREDEVSGRMIHEYTHVWQENILASSMRRLRKDDFCDVSGSRIPIWIVEGNAELFAFALQRRAPNDGNFRSEMDVCLRRIRGYHGAPAAQQRYSIRDSERGHIDGEIRVEMWGNMRTEGYDRIISYDYGVWALVLLVYWAQKTVTQFRDSFFPTLLTKTWQAALVEFAGNPQEIPDVETFYQKVEAFLRSSTTEIRRVLSEVRPLVEVPLANRQEHAGHEIVDGIAKVVSQPRASVETTTQQEDAKQPQRSPEAKKELSDKQKKLLAKLKKK